MPIDPTLNRLIKKAYLNGFGDIHHFSADKMRQYLTHPRLKDSQANYQDYLTSNEIPLRCYSPNHDTGDHPLGVVIYLSATAFIMDRLDASNDYCQLLANKLNMRVINIAHRLAPEHKFPGFLHDCLQSIEWIAQEANRLNIDPDNIALWGESSGASIAATCTHVFRDQGRQLIRSQTLFYPMVDLVTSFPSREKYAYGYMLDKSFIAWLDSQGFTAEQDRACPLASPLLSKNFHDLPPATIILAEYDPLHDEGLAYAKKLKEAGVEVALKQFDGTIHGFMRFYPKIQASIDALEFACTSPVIATQSVAKGKQSRSRND